MKKTFSTAVIVLVVIGIVAALMFDRSEDTVNVETSSQPQEAHPQEPVARESAQSASASSKPGASVTQATSPTTPSQFKTLPDPVNTDAPQQMQLWQPASGNADVQVDGAPAIRVRVQPESLQQFNVGQTVSLEIPQANTTFNSQITSTHNMSSSVKVWQGDILQATSGDNVIITQGKTQTHVVIATRDGTYSAVIDNHSGEGTLINEADIISQQAPVDDAIRIGPTIDRPPTQ